MAYDAIIILAGGIGKTGELSKNSQERVEKGVELFKQKKARVIIMSGALEAKAMREYALSFGVLRKNIFLEEKSRDTIGNAYFTKVQYLKPNNWKKIIVVTSDYHIPRVQYIFTKVCGGEFKISFESTLSNVSLEHKSFHSANEQISFLMTRLWLGMIKDGDDRAIFNKLKKLPEYGGKSKLMASPIYFSKITNIIITAFIKLRRKIKLFLSR